MVRAVLAIAILGSLVGPAMAGPGESCASRSRVLDLLSSKYAEAPVALGRTEDGRVLEVLSSLDGKTWTIIVTMPDGTSCMVAAGKGWERLPRIAVEPSA